MAEARTARLANVEEFGADTHVLRFELDMELGWTGGQYVIVNTGVPIGEGKVAKRAYSLLSSDEEQRSFTIAVRRIGTGPGSNAMLAMKPGDTLQFTGPWGKFLPSRALDAAGDGPVVVIATDTGITVALGLLRSQAFAPLLGRTQLHWLVGSDDYFLPRDFVTEQVPHACGVFEMHTVAANAGLRSEWLAEEGEAWLRSLLSQRPGAVYLAGDGLVLAQARRILGEEAGPVPSIESFFGHQLLKEQDMKATVVL